MRYEMKAKRWHECSTKMELKTKPQKWMKQEYAGAKKNRRLENVGRANFSKLDFH